MVYNPVASLGEENTLRGSSVRPRLTPVAVAIIAVAALLTPQPATSATTKGEGTEKRAWVNGRREALVSAQKFGVRVVPTVIPMRDGEMLRAVLYLPVRPPTDPGPGPCIGVLDGYAPPSAIAALGAPYGAFLSDYATRGYAGVYVHLRAMGVPEDEGLYYKYGEDGYDVVEWMADQPWCNGRVGLRGTSLLGISQWFAAKGGPPSLKAMIPDVACGDCYWGLWYVGGMLPGEGRRGRTPPLTAYDEYAAAAQHRNYDAWWRARTVMPEVRRAMARRGVKVLVTGGWDDYMLDSYTRNYTEFARAGGTGKLILGPWGHGDALLGGGDVLQPYSFDTYQLRFFDRWLKGLRNGIDDEGGALSYVEGPDQWRFERTWPIPDTKRIRLHLRSRRSGTAESLNDGSLTFAGPAAGEAKVRQGYKPEAPFNNAGGGAARLADDQRPDEARSLTWTSSRLKTNTELTGWPKLKFWASVTGGDRDFVVEITDVAPDGTSTQIGRGWLNAQRHFSRSDPKRLASGKIYGFALELWPMSRVVMTGHRVRISLAASDNPGTDPNPVASTLTVYQDSAHPSSIELPVIGNAALVRDSRAAR